MFYEFLFQCVLIIMSSQTSPHIKNYTITFFLVLMKWIHKYAMSTAVIAMRRQRPLYYVAMLASSICRRKDDRSESSSSQLVRHRHLSHISPRWSNQQAMMCITWVHSTLNPYIQPYAICMEYVWFIVGRNYISFIHTKEVLWLALASAIIYCIQVDPATTWNELKWRYSSSPTSVDAFVPYLFLRFQMRNLLGYIGGKWG